MIDPEFWSDEKVSKLDAEARLLFIGLWNFADDEGIFKNHPSLLASEIFPYEKEFTNKVAKYLKDIEEQNLIHSYSRDGQGYGIILNFKKHQSISHPQPSKLPRPSIQNQQYKNAIFRRDNFICEYCKKELTWQSKYSQDRPTIDHLIPQIKGGNDLPDNLLTACETCNKGKCDKNADVFRERSENVPRMFRPNIIKVNISKDNISKVKLSKEKIIPALDEFITYSKTLKIYEPSFDFQIEAKYNAWIANDWKDGNNKPIKNWKTKMQNTMPYFRKDNYGTGTNKKDSPRGSIDFNKYAGEHEASKPRGHTELVPDTIPK